MKATRTFQELLVAYPPEVRQTALAARAFVRELLPGVAESVDSSGPYVGYGYEPGYKGQVCTLILSKSGVKLGLVTGADLPDPHGLLEGRGKRHRHVVLKTPPDIRRPGMRELVRAAYRAGRQRNAEPV